jgi:hypothetical protein
MSAGGKPNPPRYRYDVLTALNQRPIEIENPSSPLCFPLSFRDWVAVGGKKPQNR